MIKASDILADARERVNRGWCKHRANDGLGNVCAVGAVSYAEAQAQEVEPRIRDALSVFPYTALMDAVQEFGPYASVPTFNDDPLTTKEDVLAAFDKAINGLTEKGL